MKSSTQVAPHAFKPLSRLDDFLDRMGLSRRARCRACFEPALRHPTGWTAARPLRDRRWPR